MMGLALFITVPAVANADTVYYQGYAISWDYGRRWELWSFSEVQTHRFYHSATANATWSGWKAPGVPASATQFVGTGQATAYWDCR